MREVDRDERERDGERGELRARFDAVRMTARKMAVKIVSRIRALDVRDARTGLGDTRRDGGLTERVRMTAAAPIAPMIWAMM